VSNPAPLHGSLSSVITTEGGLIEKPGLSLLIELGWKHVDLFYEQPGSANPTGRQSFREIVLPGRLRAALRKLNPSVPAEALQQAELILTADRSAMLPVAANREVYRLLRDGITVQVRQPDRSLKDERVTVIDWTQPSNNDFFLGSQVWIESSLYKRRPDALGFVKPHRI
jgi:type I restriction enzyme, R subunit